MRVLMRIQMSGLNPGKLHLTHLSCQLIIDVDPAERDLPDQLSDGSWKTIAAHQDQMNSDVQRPILARQHYSVIERRARCHHRGCREYSLAMRMNDSVVHIARVAEIVGVGDQVFQDR